MVLNAEKQVETEIEGRTIHPHVFSVETAPDLQHTFYHLFHGTLFIVHLFIFLNSQHCFKYTEIKF